MENQAGARLQYKRNPVSYIDLLQRKVSWELCVDEYM
jgi:hypothetical protein